jgi:heat shock protein HtpX
VTATVADARRDQNRQQLALLTRWCATMLVVPALAVMLLVSFATGSILIGVAVGIVVWAGASVVAYRHVRRFGAEFVAALPEGSVDDQAAARLHNLTEGICVAHGVTKPSIRIVDLDSRNAGSVVFGETDREVVLLVTRGLVDALSRIELEGLLAQQLSHVRDGDVAVGTFVAAVASIPLVGPLLGRRAGASLDQHLETVADLNAAAMTRYPPGLAAALSRLRDHPNEVPGVPATAAHLWVADPLPAGSTEPYVPHPPLADRIEVLSEL